MSKILKLLNLFLFLFLAACSSAPVKNLRINIRSEPYSLDPRVARDLPSQTITKMFFDGLTRINHLDQVELAVAEKIEVSSDGKTYTFHLREASWSNGDRVTAQDFAYGWKKVLDPNFPTDQAFQLYGIKNAKAARQGVVSLEEVGIRVKDEKTLEVELEYVVPYFEEMVAMPPFFPIHQKTDEQRAGWAGQPETFVSNGPFLMTEWKHSDHIHAVKNPHYWDAAHVKLKSIELMMVSEDAELKMYEKKEVDWAGSPLSILPLDALPALKKQKILNKSPFLATYFFRLNVEKAPFNHPLMRKAFALAINRQEIVEHVTYGQQEMATALVPPVMGLQDAPYFQDGATELAKEYFGQALKELKINVSDLPPLSLIYMSGERNHLIAQAVQQQWFETFGIRVNLESMEYKVYLDRISKRDFHLASGSWTADYKDPMNFLEVFQYKGVGSNNTGWEDSRYVDLLNNARGASTSTHRTQLLKDAERLLMEEMPLIPIFHYNLLYVRNADVHDIVLTSLGKIDFKWAYLSEETR